MRGRHVLSPVLDYGGTALVLLQLVEMAEITAGPVTQKTKYLFEQLLNRGAHFTFAQMGKTSQQKTVNANLV